MRHLKRTLILAATLAMGATTAMAAPAAPDNLRLAEQLRRSPWRLADEPITGGAEAVDRALAALESRPGAPGKVAELPRAGAPLATVVTDVDDDGLDDVVAAYELVDHPDGGLLAIFRANPDAVHPSSPAAVARRRDGTGSDRPLLAPWLLAAPVRPDRLVAADLDGDGRTELALGRAGDRTLWVIDTGPGLADGTAARRAVALPGRLTALTSCELGPRDGVGDLAVAVASDAGAALWLVRGPVPADAPASRLVPLPAAAEAVLAGGRLGERGDLVVAAGPELLLLATDPNSAVPSASVVDRAALDAPATSLVLAARPGAPALDLALVDRRGRLLRVPLAADGLGRPTVELASGASARSLAAARLPRHGGSPLVIATASGVDLVRAPGDASAVGRFTVQSALQPAVAALRLNRDAIDDLVVLEPGDLEPSVQLSGGTTFVVTDLGDQGDDCPGDGECRMNVVPGLCNDVLTPCTFIAARQEAQALGVPAVIEFQVSGPLPIQFDLTSVAYFNVPVTIDGTTQPGYAGTPVVSFARATGNTPFSVAAGTSVVRGVSLIGNGLVDSNGLWMTCNDNLVEGSWIGLGPGGTPAPFERGLQLETFDCDACGCLLTGNRIGGRSQAARNVISGNTSAGVDIDSRGVVGAINGVTVEGNFIGTNPVGSAALGNGSGDAVLQAGVVVQGKALGVLIGGTAAGAANLISGNDGDGVEVRNQDVAVVGNLVGTDLTGTTAIPNTLHGVQLSNQTADVTIGGAAGGSANTISGNGGDGVNLAGANDGVLVLGNRIGLAAFTAGTLGNGGSGVHVAGLDSPGLRVGGTLAGEANEIAGNGAAGVSTLANQASGQTVAISGNSIHDNTGLAIDLESDGVTPDDPGDPDAGPNGLQNFPQVTSAAGDGTDLVVTGSLNSTPAGTFQVEVYASPACDPSGHGEARTFLGSFAVTTNAAGDASFSETVSALGVADGDAITALAQSASGTSELGPCATAAVVDVIFADGFESGDTSAWSGG